MKNDKNIDKTPDFLTIKELQELLRVSKGTAYGLVHSGEIRAILVGRQWRIPCKEYERFAST